MQTALNQPFSNVQLELLKAFSHQLNEKDLLELRAVMAKFFAKKLMNQADKIWDEEKWNEDDLLSVKLRKTNLL
jgi:hypothetical protein